MLYHIARKKDTFVAEYLCWHNGIAHWDALFVRPIQDWELTSLESFFDLPHSSKVDGNEEDKVAWVVAWSGSFEDSEEECCLISIMDALDHITGQAPGKQKCGVSPIGWN
ncbi:hypothetical protein SO802_019741 [Lithocarpus litseifolius]|uniref:Uncharacterized protein n=1 Tax=Lithocarpus litseifolius TaxID=425828 RepID=A0AAW2CQP1_9ROSI